jgi:hypothetical protein
MTEFFEKTTDNSVKPAEFQVFKFFLIPFTAQHRFGQFFFIIFIEF